MHTYSPVDVLAAYSMFFLDHIKNTHQDQRARDDKKPPYGVTNIEITMINAVVMTELITKILLTFINTFLSLVSTEIRP